VGLITLPCKKKKIVEKPPRNLAGFFEGGQGLSWAAEQRKDEEIFLIMYGLKVQLIKNFHCTNHVPM
jgi:hypothetical protein